VKTWPAGYRGLVFEFLAFVLAFALLERLSHGEVPGAIEAPLRSQIFGLYLSCHALVQMGSLPLPAKFQP
jgi:hypothetical protein